MTETYQQSEKNAVRDRILPAAILALTKNRAEACLIRENELIPTVEYFLESLKRLGQGDAHTQGTLSEAASWLDYHSIQVGTKTANSIRVLYLCGPEPMNDLNVLIRSGINPHNVWAVTDKKDHQAAVDSSSAAGVPLKVHCGQLAEFFDVFNESFDIIYFDACGPIAGGDPNTLKPIISIFERQRLNSPGVLITNFCEPPDHGDARDRYVDLATAFFSSRYNDLPSIIHESELDPAEFVYDLKLLRNFAAHNLEPLYSHLITRLIIDIGMFLLPNCRALSMGALFRGYLSGESGFKESQNRANDSTIDLSQGVFPGDLLMSPSSYPIASFISNLEQSRPNDPVLKLLSDPFHRQPRRSLRDLVEASSLLARVAEGHWDMLSQGMQVAVATSWFDTKDRITCDVPLPNLIVNSLVGIYGRPWFANTRLSQRVTYRAKVRRMYCDLLVLDQCRPYFDWFPTMHACPSRFKSIPFQIVARSILDRIERHDSQAEAHPFSGSAVFGAGEHDVARRYKFREREHVL